MEVATQKIIDGVSSAIEFDARDELLRVRNIAVWEKKAGPRVGDFVRMLDGTTRRFTHHHGDQIQTTVARDKGHYHASFYFGEGYMEFSGSLDPGIKLDKLAWCKYELKLGSAWFFHHGQAGGSRGVYFNIPCRVFVQITKDEDILPTQKKVTLL